MYICAVLCAQAQLCLTLCDHMDCSLLSSSVHGIFQARILERIAICFSQGSSQPRDRTWVSCIAGRVFTVWATFCPRYLLFFMLLKIELFSFSLKYSWFTRLCWNYFLNFHFQIVYCYWIEIKSILIKYIDIMSSNHAELLY